MNITMKRLLTSILIVMIFLALAYTALYATPSTSLKLFHAGSLIVPFKRLGEEFEKNHPNVKVEFEAYGSIRAARQVTDLGRECDVLGVSDYQVIERLMFPEHADWYLIFASNEIVIAYTDDSKYANEISADNWYAVLTRPDVTFGRSDPDVDPCGHRTLLTWKLACTYYNDSSIYDNLLDRCPEPTMPKESDLVVRLELGQLDYAFEYKSLAVQHGLRFVDLPAEIDLSDPELADLYRTVSVTLGDGTTVEGAPILYAVTIPNTASQTNLAIDFVSILLGPTGQEMLREYGQNPITPAITNDLESLPEALRENVSEWS